MSKELPVSAVTQQEPTPIDRWALYAPILRHACDADDLKFCGVSIDDLDYALKQAVEYGLTLREIVIWPSDSASMLRRCCDRGIVVQDWTISRFERDDSEAPDDTWRYGWRARHIGGGYHEVLANGDIDNDGDVPHFGVLIRALRAALAERKAVSAA